ncbi:MAG: adenylate kinase [Mariprofundaceae bacterium]
MHLVLFGPPGVGKGTQGGRLAESLNMPVFAMGDLLRKAVQDATALGLSAKTYMDAGKLVPDDVVVGMIEERILASGMDEGFLLDGFPRNTSQAEALTKMLDRIAVQLDHIIFMDAAEASLLERLAGRLICRGCGFGFHRHYSPPRKAGCCDKCSGELYQRDDDREEVIAERLKVYMQQTEPVLNYYSKDASFCSIDADGDAEAVYQRLLSVVKG